MDIQVLNDEVNPMCRNIADCQSLIIQAFAFKQTPNIKTNSDVYWNTPRTYNNTIMIIGSVFKEVSLFFSIKIVSMLNTNVTYVHKINF